MPVGVRRRHARAPRARGAPTSRRPTSDAELAPQVAAAQARRHVEIGDPAVVVAGLRAAIETPLGPLLDGLRLRDVRRADRLDELDFELPLAGGDEPTGQLALAAIGAAAPRAPAGRRPARRLRRAARRPALRRTVRGYLTGSLDLVAAAAGRRGVPRFAVLDYKTNWLGARRGPDAPGTTARRRSPPRCSAPTTALQALLYTVALHRYLRWRLPGYDPERNLAGVLYLFLRGMTGPDTPRSTAAVRRVRVAAPRALVEALSDVLDGRGPEVTRS